MGSGMSALTDGDAPLVARVPCWFRAWERRLSRFSPDSELSRLNAATAPRVTVSHTLGKALAAALFAAEWTRGLVTPTTLGALEAAGYDRTFAEVTDVPGRTHPHVPPDFRDVVLEQAHVVARPPGLRLDLGGTAKGLCADRAAARLARCAPALVDAGGDIAVSGPRRDGSPWLIAVESPVDRARPLALLAVARGGVATSGRDRRAWKKDGRAVHHVIDPRSGEPAVTDVLTATVVGASALAAEVAAKVVLVLGVRDGLAWLDANGLAGLAVDEQGRAHRSTRIGDHLV